jgi:hypothetical protein
MKAHTYIIEARSARPDMEQEQRYVQMEREYARKEAAKLKGKWWPFFSYPEMGILRHHDWQNYEHALDAYEEKVERHIKEMQDGLLPCSVVVHHDGPKADRRIRIKVRAEHGSFHVKKHAPKRPKRIDGAPEKSEREGFTGFHGFVRSGVKLAGHSLQAEFSKLDQQDSALLILDTLYFDCTRHTKLRYEIHSEALPGGIRGEVEL